MAGVAEVYYLSHARHLVPQLPDERKSNYMGNTNLPDKVVTSDGEIVVYTPPANFEVLSRGVSEPVKFTHHGDSFVGIFEDAEKLEDDDGKPFMACTFTGPDGKPYVIFPGAILERAMRRVEPKQWVRITYIGDVDTGKPSPLKSYVVEVAKG